MEGDQYEDRTREVGAAAARFIYTVAIGICLVVAFGALMAAWGLA